MMITQATPSLEKSKFDAPEGHEGSHNVLSDRRDRVRLGKHVCRVPEDRT
jgi:hypothetical protein